MKKLLSLICAIYLAFAPTVYGATDVYSHSTLPTSLVSYWDMDSSAVWEDKPGTYNLTDNNAVGFLSGANCKHGGCADFTPNDNLSIAEQTEFVYNGSTNRSVSFCFYADALSGTVGLVGMYDPGIGGSGENWLVYLNGTSLILLVRNQGAAVTWGSAISTGTWYHVVATMDSSNSYQLIVNDGTPATGSGGTGTVTGAHTFRIGAYGVTATGHFNGRIDEVGFWTKKLSAGEITDLYNSSNCLPYQATSTPSTTVTPNDIIFY